MLKTRFAQRPLNGLVLAALFLGSCGGRQTRVTGEIVMPFPADLCPRLAVETGHLQLTFRNEAGEVIGARDLSGEGSVATVAGGCEVRIPYSIELPAASFYEAEVSTGSVELANPFTYTERVSKEELEANDFRWDIRLRFPGYRLDASMWVGFGNVPDLRASLHQGPEVPVGPGRHANRAGGGGRAVPQPTPASMGFGHEAGNAFCWNVDDGALGTEALGFALHDVVTGRAVRRSEFDDRKALLVMFIFLHLAVCAPRPEGTRRAGPRLPGPGRGDRCDQASLRLGRGDRPDPRGTVRASSRGRFSLCFDRA
jgi:hypothetical protein